MLEPKYYSVRFNFDRGTKKLDTINNAILTGGMKFFFVVFFEIREISHS